MLAAWLCLTVRTESSHETASSPFSGTIISICRSTTCLLTSSYGISTNSEWSARTLATALHLKRARSPRGACVSLRLSPNWANSARLVAVGAVALLAVFQPLQAIGQEPLTRKVKSKVAPVYPDLARRMNITGTVRVVVVVSSNGTVKSTKLVGGHPILVTAALNDRKKWKFEPASDESTGLVEFKFQPSD